MSGDTRKASDVSEAYPVASHREDGRADEGAGLENQ